MKKGYRRVVAAVYSTPWAILPEKLQQIQAVLALRTQGVRLPKEEIAARIGNQRSQPAPTTSGKISVLNIYGTLAPRLSAMQDVSGGVSADAVSKAFADSVNNPEVSAIVLNIDSPGGAVGGIAELSKQIFDARGKKPIIAVANGQMASAALWIGSAADEVVATPSATDIGSYGVMSIHQDDTKALEKEGIEQTVIGSTEFKTEGWGPMTESLKARMQERVDAISAQFGMDLARNYGVSLATVNSRFGKGRTFLASEALDAGLVKRIGTLQSVLAELGSVAGSKSSTATAAASPANGAEISTKGKTMTFEQWCLSQGRDVAKLDAVQTAMMRGLFDSISAGAAVDPLTVRSRIDSICGSALGAIGHDGSSTPVISQVPQIPKMAAGVSASDIVAQVNLAPLTADAKLKLIQSLTKESSSLTYSSLLERVNEAAVSQNSPSGATRIDATESEQDKFHAAARDAILVRTYGSNLPTEIYSRADDAMVPWSAPKGRDFSLASLPRMAEACLIQAGVPANKVKSLSAHDISRLVMGANPRDFGIYASQGDPGAYNVTGMFTNIFTDAQNVILRRSYLDANVTYDMWMKRGESLVDFKPVHKIIAGELSDPKVIPEDGEFEDTTLSDSQEQYRLFVWGEKFSVSWQTIVNDRLSSFTEIPMKQGRAMRRKQNRICYQILKDNANLADSGALFNSSAQSAAGGHNNIGTGTLTTVADYITAWNGMAKRMSEMKGLNISDSSTLNIMPKWVIFPGALRGIILQALGSISSDPTNPGIRNIWQQGLQPILEPELGSAGTGGSDLKHYLAADYNDVDTVEYAFLQGLESPAFESYTSFERLGIAMRVYQPFAAKALDYRGLQRHNGA